MTAFAKMGRGMSDPTSRGCSRLESLEDEGVLFALNKALDPLLVAPSLESLLEKVDPRCCRLGATGGCSVWLDNVMGSEVQGKLSSTAMGWACSEGS